MKQENGSPDAPLGSLICFSVYSAEHAFNQLYRGLLGELGLTYPQYLVLTLLWAKDDRTVSELGSALRLQSNTLTPLLKRLEALRLVARRRDREDERVVRVTLTGQGRSLQERAAEIPQCVGRATGLSARELEDAIALLNRLRDSVEMAANGDGAAVD
ncbi:MAG: MarR family transcriptional regulator [Oricola sp.]